MSNANTKTIAYAVSVDCTYRTGEWTGPMAEAIEAAADALSAYEAGEGYRYDDDGMRATYEVSAEDMAELGAALLSGHSLAEAYSIWCAGTVPEEVTGAEWHWG